MDYRKKVYVTLLLVACVLGLPALLVWYADPFQIFHRPLLSHMGLRENQRYQNAGLINSYWRDKAEAYDSIALGTSMSANITSESLRKAFGWHKSLRLFIKGGGPGEVRQTGEHALRHGKVRHLLWEINPWFTLQSYEGALANEDFPAYLYNENPLDDARYVFNLDSLRFSLALLGGDRSDNYLSLENLGMNEKEAERREAFNTTLKNRLADSASVFVTLTPWPEAKRRALHLPVLGREVFPFIDELCNSDTEVVIYLPPLSKLHYAEAVEAAYPVIYMPRKILERMAPCHNMRLHAFDLMPFTADMANYRDPMHYTRQISEDLLQLMAKGEQRLSLETISAYEDEWIRQLNTHHIYTTYFPEKKRSG